MHHPLISSPETLQQTDAVTALCVARVMDFIDRMRNDVDSKARLPGTIELWRFGQGRIKRLPPIVDAHGDLLRADIRLKPNTLTGLTTIGMNDDIAYRLVDC